MTQLRDRLRAFLSFARPRLTASGADLDRLVQLRRLSDVRVRAFAVGRPRVTGLDLCELLSDPKTGRFDALAGGLLRRADLESALEPLGEEMGALVETCLLLQVVGPATLQGLLKEAIASIGALADVPSAKAPTSPAARPLAAAKELWTAPAAPLRAMKLLEERDPKPDLVAAEIEKDSSFGSRFLRIATALNGGPRMTSIGRAIVSLGSPVTRQVIGLGTLLPKLGTDADYWTHALRVACAASLAAKTADSWIAGLLHEAGTPLKARYAAGSEVSAAEIGAFVLERWKFSPGVVGAARHHGDSIDAIEDASLPREAVVAAACCRLVKGEGGRWTALLRLAPPQASEVVAEADRRAKAVVAEFTVC